MNVNTGSALAGVLLFALGFQGCASTAEQSQTDPAPEQIEQARFFLELVRDKNGMTGLSAAVVMDGELVWSEGFGFADAENKIPATPDTVYRAGSISKVLTAAALMRLYDDRKVDLDTDIRSYVPEFPEKHWPVTTRQLAGHLGGVRHYKMGETAAPKERYDDVIDALELFSDDPLLHEPGTKWSYSSYGWTLVSAVIQRAAGASFQDYMHEAVFAPLGLEHTSLSIIDKTPKNFARLYDEGEPVERNDISYIWAAGGMLSTVEDLAKFGWAFMPGGAYLSEDGLALMTANQRTTAGDEVVSGIGWMVDRFPDGERVLYHGGTILGGHSLLYVEPGSRIVVAIMGNEAAGFGLLDGYIVASQFLGREGPPPEFLFDSKAKKLSRENWARFDSSFEGFHEALTEGDIARIMSFVSPDFSSTSWPDRTALRKQFAEWLADGGLTIGGELAFGMRGSEPGSTADISGLVLDAGGKPVALTLIWTMQPDMSWLLSDMIREGE